MARAVDGDGTKGDYVIAFSAQPAAAIAVHFFSIVGIPVSTTQTVVGAVAAMWLLNGFRTVQKVELIKTAVGLVATPLSAGILSFLVYKLIALAL